MSKLILTSIVPAGLILFTLLILPVLVSGQVWYQQILSHDSSSRNPTISDTISARFQEVKKNVTKSFRKFTQTNTFKPALKKINPFDTSTVNSLSAKWAVNSLFDKKISLLGGYNNYTYNYQGYIDTPIAQSAITQHVANGYIGVKFFGIPLSVFYFINHSNTLLFKNITDVRVDFDAPQFAQSLSGRLNGITDSYLKSLKDSLGMLTSVNKQAITDYLHLKDRFNSEMLRQQYKEYNEVLQLDNYAYTPDKADSINSKVNDSLKNKARTFFKYYDSLRVATGNAKKVFDSLEKIYYRINSRIAQIKNLQKIKTNPVETLTSTVTILQEIRPDFKIPSLYNRLLNIRQFSIGRSRLDYSELTGKNINLKGVNFEYSSKRIYLAFAAGGIDYRYRDFGLPLYNTVKQFMYMARVGKGRPEQNHFYLTLYKGQKQLTPSFSFNPNPPAVASVTGISGELKYVVKENTTIVVEAAESAAPDYRSQPVKTAKFRFTDSRAQAIAVAARSYLPKTNTKIDAFYKYTGANFQSFSSFVSNNTLTSWQLKIDQPFLKRKLRVSGSLKQNVFTNPYIPQRYDSKTVLKSLYLTYKERRRPVISAGYMPVSQLIKLDNQVFETQFNSLSVSAFHQYRIKIITAASMLMVNRFYNSATDSAFAYYNAVNVFFNQLFSFSKFSLTAAVNHMKSRDYELSVLNGGIAVPFGKQNQVSFGFKVNNFNKEISRTGTYGSLQLNLKKFGVLAATYDMGYVPASNKQFIPNEFMIISLTQNF